MVQIKLIFMLIFLSISWTVDTKVTFNRMIVNEKIRQNDANVVKRCDELSPIILNDILGAAFNSRCVFHFTQIKIMKIIIF